MLLVAGLLLAAGCRTGIIYVGDDVPVYQGVPEQPAAVAVRGDTVRVAAFNIRYAARIDRALEVLRSEPDLRLADVLLLQEMDAEGTRVIAEGLGMFWVYYPAVRHTVTGRDFGNAVVSRWPIVAHERLLLPHVGRITRTRRAATAATIDISGRTLRVYSVHLATIFEIGPNSRADQLCAVMDDADRFRSAIIGGDLNSSLVGEVAEKAGWEWPTGWGAPTALGGRLDHLLLSGLKAVPGRGGVIREVRGASDHRPVWVDAVILH
jgi:endonuclease/exonuclease/phosphatase family metal-dependent hydrolase